MSLLQARPRKYGKQPSVKPSSPKRRRQTVPFGKSIIQRPGSKSSFHCVLGQKPIPAADKATQAGARGSNFTAWPSWHFNQKTLDMTKTRRHKGMFGLDYLQANTASDKVAILGKVMKAVEWNSAFFASHTCLCQFHCWMYIMTMVTDISG